jgi:hypothetical protein
MASESSHLVAHFVDGVADKKQRGEVVEASRFA